MAAEEFKFILAEFIVDEENIEIAIVSERWLVDDGTHTWYPPEEEHGDWGNLARAHAEPQEDWIIYPIRIRKICREFKIITIS